MTNTKRENTATKNITADQMATARKRLEEALFEEMKMATASKKLEEAIFGEENTATENAITNDSEKENRTMENITMEMDVTETIEDEELARDYVFDSIYCAIKKYIEMGLGKKEDDFDYEEGITNSFDIAYKTVDNVIDEFGLVKEEKFNEFWGICHSRHAELYYTEELEDWAKDFDEIEEFIYGICDTLEADYAA